MKLGDIAARIGAELRGDAAIDVTGIAALQVAEKGQISFLSNPRYRKYLSGTRASAVILDSAAAPVCPVAALICDNPYAGFAKASGILNPREGFDEGAHETAWISGSARIGAGCWIGPHVSIGEDVRVGHQVYIGPGCVIEKNVSLGAGSRLVANVTLCERVEIGERALIHPGVVIGSDGFGIAQEEGRWIKVPQLGTVRIGDDVEIGANTTIDRGALEDTVIADGVKLDNQIQVAHNVRIGAHTAIAGCVGIAGSARIGSHCTIGGGAGILGHLELVDDVHVTAMSLVTSSIMEPGLYSSGVPLQVNREWRRNFVRFKHLDDMARRLRRLEKGGD